MIKTVLAFRNYVRVPKIQNVLSDYMTFDNTTQHIIMSIK